MRERFEKLLMLANEYKASDVHFVLEKKILQVSMRGIGGMTSVQKDLFDESFFQYLKYLANLDLGSRKPQSNAFSIMWNGKKQYFRFSLIVNETLETGVLRILNNHPALTLNDLTSQKKVVRSMIHWCRFRCGMVILSGPTGSGKTTTLHALLHHINEQHNLKIITLEDPIEIISDEYLQLQVNEAQNFTYEEGIKQLLRHDPDIIMIGEIRDATTARMAYRCALSGHMVFSCIHAKSATEAIKRLEELGISKEELKHTLTAVCSQRLFPKKNGKERICVYEVLEKTQLNHYLEGWDIENEHTTMEDAIREAVTSGWISKKSAQSDIEMETK